jgi:hypothetical protein
MMLTSTAPPHPPAGAGERCSCTTAVTDLLHKNFDVRCADLMVIKQEEMSSREARPKYRRECVIGGLPWKHGARSPAPLPPDPRFPSLSKRSRQVDFPGCFGTMPPHIALPTRLPLRAGHVGSTAHDSAGGRVFGFGSSRQRF